MISRRRLLKWLMALGLAGVAAPVYGVAAEPFFTRVTRYNIVPGRWPAGFDLTIAVVADLHACKPWMTPERIVSIVAQTNALGADVILLLGDYVSTMGLATDWLPEGEWAPALAALKAPLGVHAILGNHDWWADHEAQRNGHGPVFSRRLLERVGIPVYENNVVRLTKDGQPFWLAGLGDQLAFMPSLRSYPDRHLGVDDLTRTLSLISDDAPVILMAHEPDIMPRVPDRVSLVLSGHTHGGQVRMFGWSPIVPSHFRNRYAYGHVREQTDLIVSGGLGCSIVPVRFGVPPEILMVRLSGGNSA